MIEKCSFNIPPPWSPSEPHPQAAVFPAPSRQLVMAGVGAAQGPVCTSLWPVHQAQCPH